jgi:hypothetical protein
LEDLGIDGRILLVCIITIWWTGFIWIKMGSSDGLLWT